MKLCCYFFSMTIAWVNTGTHSYLKYIPINQTEAKTVLNNFQSFLPPSSATYGVHFHICFKYLLSLYCCFKSVPLIRISDYKLSTLHDISARGLYCCSFYLFYLISSNKVVHLQKKSSIKVHFQPSRGSGQVKTRDFPSLMEK